MDGRRFEIVDLSVGIFTGDIGRRYLMLTLEQPVSGIIRNLALDELLQGRDYAQNMTKQEVLRERVPASTRKEDTDLLVSRTASAFGRELG